MEEINFQRDLLGTLDLIFRYQNPGSNTLQEALSLSLCGCKHISFVFLASQTKGGDANITN